MASKDPIAFPTHQSLIVEPVEESDKRKVGLLIVTHAPKEEWDMFLRMLGIKEYEPAVVKENGISRDAVTRRKLVFDD